MLDKAHLKDEEEEEKHQKILLQLCINLALTCNKMAEPKRCISWCKRALEIRGIDNTSKTKALYHYGKVYYKMNTKLFFFNIKWFLRYFWTIWYVLVDFPTSSFIHFWIFFFFLNCIWLQFLDCHKSVCNFVVKCWFLNTLLLFLFPFMLVIWFEYAWFWQYLWNFTGSAQSVLLWTS